MNIIAATLAFFAFATAGEAPVAPRFAEDLPLGVGFSAVFGITLGENGEAKACAFSGMHELTKTANAVGIKPSAAYISDACKKLSRATWRVERDARGAIQNTYYFCRYWPSNPDHAYCEKRFGE